MKKINIRRTVYHLKHQYFTLNNVVVAVALLIAASWAWGSIGVMQRNFALQKEIDAKQREQRLLELETQNLAFEQRYYKSREYLELQVRERLGLALPGERALVLPPNSRQATMVDNDTVGTPRSATQSTNFEQWLNFLFGGNSHPLQ